MEQKNSPKLDSKPKPIPIDFNVARQYLKKDQDIRMVALARIRSSKGAIVPRGTHIKVDWSAALLLIESKNAVPLDYLMDRQLLILPIKHHA